MCGIVGYAGGRNALPILLDGLKRLEYRGYDSAGVAIVGSALQVVKDKGFIANLEAQLPAIAGSTGFAHTRWATHGAPSKVNAHPHVDCTGKIALAHNGIIENFAALREKLEARGHRFVSQTDTESLVHLIESYYEGDLEDATRKALHEARGSYAILAVHADEPGRVVGARNESPLVIGLGPDENFLASDVPALLRYTDRVLYVMDKEMVVITPKGVAIKDLEGHAVTREPQRITWSLEDAEKGGFDHFMLKEIHEAPKAIHETLLGRLANLEVDGFLSEGITSVKLVACGTSYHAAMIGKYILEEIARIPASAELASEYRYSQGPTDRPLVILITQSGETADTLGAAREARRRGCKTLGITNILGSSLTREVDTTLYTRAGIEIAVAGTKTFIAQLIVLYLIALKMGQDRGTLGYDDLDRLKDQLRSLPRTVQNVLDRSAEIRALAAKYGNARDIFYIGRHANYPVALEGALKLKEISYIHAEAYAAGELKHGPLALVTPQTPVIAVAVQDPTYDKVRSNIGEVSARGAPVLALGTSGDRELAKYVDDVIEIPEIPWVFSPVPVSVALQLFAYEVARLHDCPIDKPRNLAKSVTVE
ncbi:MAG: glutamine--fructose-6-phosphate transaminase (isomerizing) [Methanobacteriota archaeon]|nr:MAG: glutamine--fructose-6-phosphate transaminase (isomerizing) [Euryarchaeota archaeon]